ncbi:hypothetical protein N6H14_22720 [Paenibacillus sp. CC-CFT747]|nr:hypothetical protein N6H14_22720 [Paenibacillus sp. CC-CFT747]
MKHFTAKLVIFSLLLGFGIFFGVDMAAKGRTLGPRPSIGGSDSRAYSSAQGNSAADGNPQDACLQTGSGLPGNRPGGREAAGCRSGHGLHIQ